MPAGLAKSLTPRRIRAFEKSSSGSFTYNARPHQHSQTCRLDIAPLGHTLIPCISKPSDNFRRFPHRLLLGPAGKRLEMGDKEKAEDMAPQLGM